MNLHGIVRGAIGAVNPNVTVQWSASTGNSTAADGKRSPEYATPQPVVAQVQTLTTQDLRQVDSLNLQGTMRTLYMSGAASAVVRRSAKGGDLFVLSDGTTWLVTSVLETWPDWCKLLLTLQDDT